jgi:hypothetical protein
VKINHSPEMEMIYLIFSDEGLDFYRVNLSMVLDSQYYLITFAANLPELNDKKRRLPVFFPDNGLGSKGTGFSTFG